MNNAKFESMLKPRKWTSLHSKQLDLRSNNSKMQEKIEGKLKRQNLKSKKSSFCFDKLWGKKILIKHQRLKSKSNSWRNWSKHRMMIFKGMRVSTRRHRCFIWIKRKSSWNQFDPKFWLWLSWNRKSKVKNLLFWKLRMKNPRIRKLIYWKSKRNFMK